MSKSSKLEYGKHSNEEHETVLTPSGQMKKYRVVVQEATENSGVSRNFQSRNSIMDSVGTLLKWTIPFCLAFFAYQFDLLSQARDFFMGDMKALVNEMKSPYVTDQLQNVTPGLEVPPDAFVYDPTTLKNYGRVTFKATPDANIILINGKPAYTKQGYSIKTPKELKLAPGKYVVTLKSTAIDRQKSQTIYVEANKGQVVEMILNIYSN
jgi:hypothetical protein